LKVSLLINCSIRTLPNEANAFLRAANGAPCHGRGLVRRSKRASCISRPSKNGSKITGVYNRKLHPLIIEVLLPVRDLSLGVAACCLFLGSSHSALILGADEKIEISRDESKWGRLLAILSEQRVSPFQHTISIYHAE
jgi:hypothetical protein